MSRRPSLTRLDLADDPDRYRGLGFFVDHGQIRIGRLSLTILGGEGGLTGWGFDTELGERVAGVPVTGTAPLGATAPMHPNGAQRVDHVVLRTDNLAATVAELGRVGITISKRRAVPGSAMTQAFVRLGDPVLELVGDDSSIGGRAPQLWGLAITVADADVASEHLGAALGPWRPAVQPGRRIATVSAEAGLSTAVALMTPES